MKGYCTFYIVRHGQTDWNVKKLMQGHTDIPLNKEGELQAQKMAKKLRRIHFTTVYSSDLLRAKQTAEIITLKKKIVIKTTKALRERFYGRLEGKSWADDRNELAKLWEKLYKLTEKERKIFHLEKVENNEDLMNRFIPVLREIAVAYPQKNVLIVTHGGIMRAFLIHLGYGTEKTLPSGSIKNTAYLRLDCDGVDFFIKETFGVEKMTG